MSHAHHDNFGLALAELIADELPNHPEWIEYARANLEKWSALNAHSPSLLACYDEWRRLLALPSAQLQALLRERSDNAQRLRQNSPFVGILPPSEIRRLRAASHATSRA